MNTQTRLGVLKAKNALGNNRYFDPKLGLIVASVFGVIVFSINYKYGVGVASIAASKQMAYNFLVGGFFTRLCENIATGVTNAMLAISLAVIVAGGITILLNFVVHSLKGTPNAFESTFPTMVSAPFSMLYWALRKRRQLIVLQQNK